MHALIILCNGLVGILVLGLQNSNLMCYLILDCPLTAPNYATSAQSGWGRRTGPNNWGLRPGGIIISYS
jgi:hypothetical protein